MMSERSAAFWPGMAAALISGHLGLQVTVMNRSGFPNFRMRAIASW